MLPVSSQSVSLDLFPEDQSDTTVSRTAWFTTVILFCFLKSVICSCLSFNSRFFMFTFFPYRGGEFHIIYCYSSEILKLTELTEINGYVNTT